MKTIYTFLALFIILNIKVQAQVSVTSSGVPAVYATLKAAFDAINAGTQFGVVNITITANTTELLPATLNPSTGPANYSSITILPTVACTISGNLNGPLINLNGAQNVTIDGRIGAAGSTRSLTIQNNSILNGATVSTILFVNGASNNTLQYINIQGSGKSNISSTVFLATTSASQGNSNNLISNNDIGPAGANIPFNAISSAGSPLSNDANSITNNLVHDFFNPAGISSGVRCGTNSSGWTISGNSFYHTTPKVSTNNIAQNIIYVFSGVGYTINNNFIGGSLPNAGAPAASFSGGFYNLVVPILLQNLDATTVNGNTITNFNIVSTPTANAPVFSGIQTFGNINVGLTSGNVIGASTGTGAISVTIQGNNSCAVLGIVAGGATNPVDIRNNIIGSISLNSIGAGIAGFTGISTDIASVNIQNNSIGGTTAASIQTTTPNALIAGISIFQNINVVNQVCTGNTIRNLKNNGIGSAAITGILSQIVADNVHTANTITNNTITNLSSPSASPTFGSVQGIVLTQTVGFSNSTSNGNINNNQINNLSSASTGASTIVRGISHENGYPGFLNINSNNIHILSAAAPNTASGITGVVQAIASIVPSTGVVSFSNNIIYDLENTAAASTNVIGIGCVHGDNINTASLSKNRIFDLRNPNAAATGLVSAMAVSGSAGAGTFGISNNMLSLSPANVQTYGIHNISMATQINLFFNSIVISGTATGNNNSGAFFRNAVATNINSINNIFYNTRSGGTGAHYSIVNTNGTPATGWVSDYNDLYNGNPSTIALWGATPMDFATYQSNSAQDNNAKSVVVTFTDIPSADLHLSGPSIGDPNLNGQNIVVFDDYDGDPRGAVPYIGADEIPFTSLPIGMEYFRGKTQGTTNVLNWKISCGAAYIVFDVQRSSDGRNFASIGQFTALQQRCEQPFDFTDKNPVAGVNYYRLKMTEEGGAKTYSIILPILVKKAGFDLIGLYPSLVRDNAVLSISSASNTTMQFVVSDLQGRVINKLTEAIPAGTSTINMNFALLPKGNYQLSAYRNDGTVSTIRFVKQ